MRSTAQVPVLDTHTLFWSESLGHLRPLPAGLCLGFFVTRSGGCELVRRVGGSDHVWESHWQDSKKGLSIKAWASTGFAAASRGGFGEVA